MFMGEFNMHEKMGVFKQFKESITNFQSYTYFYRETLGKAIFYIFIISLLLGLIESIRPIVGMTGAFTDMKTVVKENFPELTIKNGILSAPSDVRMPICIDDGDTLILMDTTEKLDTGHLSGYSQGALIDPYGITYSNGIKMQYISFENIEDRTIMAEDIDRLIGMISLFINVILIIFMPLASFVGKLWSVFVVMGIIGMIMSAIKKLGFSYGEGCKLAAYALTVPMILSTFLIVIGIAIPYFGLLYYAIGGFYLYKGMLEVIKEKSLGFDDEPTYIM